MDYRTVHYPTLDDNPDFSTEGLTSDMIAEIDAVNRQVRTDLESMIPGFTVAIASSLRLNNYTELRFLPGLSFGNRKMVFNVPIHDMNQVGVMTEYSTRSTYLDFPLLIKYKAKRMVNQRPYVVFGPALRVDISRSATDDLVKFNTVQYFWEMGIGWDSYLQYFRFSGELKFGIGLDNILGKLPEPPQPTYYMNSMKRLSSNIVTLSFHFE